MSTQKLSRAAYERLVAELTDLTTRGRIEVAEEIELARTEGDLRENAGYHAAKDKQGHMEGRIRQLEHLLDGVEVVDEGGQTIYTMIYAGDSPDDAERYVVGSQEERAGLPDDVTIVGPSSPLGIALQTMDGPGMLEYDGPAGRLTVEILAVEEI